MPLLASLKGCLKCNIKAIVLRVFISKYVLLKRVGLTSKQNMLSYHYIFSIYSDVLNSILNIFTFVLKLWWLLVRTGDEMS